VEIVEAPTSATPGSIVEYEFELYSFGLHPSDLLDLSVEIRGEAGTMTPLSSTNHPFGSNGSTLPNTELLSIDCLSSSLGSYPVASVFPASPAPWQDCPTSGLIPIPVPASPSNTAPVTGFANDDFLANLPGTLDGPPGGGVMRFRAEVLVGDPVCVDEPDAGVRDLVFEFSVDGLQGTDLVPPGPADNIATMVTEVPGTCEVADIAFTTSSDPATLTVDANGEATWFHEVTVTNASATETLDIPRFIDQTFAFSVDAEIVSIDCTELSGGAQCPPTAVMPGVQTSASGSTTPLSNPLHIDHEWGSIGNDTFPPGGSIEFVITAQLSNPGNTFSCISNQASFNGQNDPNGWIPAQDSAATCPPPGPELSVQKRVVPQIAEPGDLVTYTVTIVNIGSAAADGTELIDPLPGALLGSNPNGYINVTCSDISNAGFIPNPQGTAVCPPVTSDANGLTATIATMGPNSALELTYQAVMPESIVSVDNLVTVSAPSAGGLSFGAGTAQSQQNVQVQAQPTGEPPPTDPEPEPTPVPVPLLGPSALILLTILTLMVGIGYKQGRLTR